MDLEPTITVGIIDRQGEVSGNVEQGTVNSGVALSGAFSARAEGGLVLLRDGEGREVARTPIVHLATRAGSTFRLFGVTIGKGFHWERKEDQVFQGSLILHVRGDGTVAAVNELPLEGYLESVVSSEMSGRAPFEFLKAHAILSRSWLLAALAGKKGAGRVPSPVEAPSGEEGLIRWYDREDHDLYDVCADDHCQRYQGITKIVSDAAREAVRATTGMALTWQGAVCDARYSKACGGLTENFATAWGDETIPYLTSVSDSPATHKPVTTEEEAGRWILSEPDAYCNATDRHLLAAILPGFDQETDRFFRWTIGYPRAELEVIIREKSGLDLGTLEEITPLRRGPSGRIRRLRIRGSKRAVEVGKELEIRRWLSRSHLLSSAFIVETRRAPSGQPERFVFHGAGWGHGVGLCQIGAAVMASKGWTAHRILGHYFRGAQVERVY